MTLSVGFCCGGEREILLSTAAVATGLQPFVYIKVVIFGLALSFPLMHMKRFIS